MSLKASGVKQGKIEKTEKTEKSFIVWRFILVSVILCLLMAMSHSFYIGKFGDIIVKLENADDDMETVIWLIKHIGNFFPCILTALVQYIFYPYDRNTVRAQKERKFEILVLAVFFFFVLLPYAMNDGQGNMSLSNISDTSLWFATQSVPMLILFMYYSQRQKALTEEISEGENE